MINPATLIKIKGALGRFSENHPKLKPFIRAISGKVEEGTIIEINVTTSAGETISTNMKLTESDMELFEELKKMM